MNKIEYESLQETVYTETMANGLKVTVIPKPRFNKTYGLFTTHYGSVDTKFVPIGLEQFATVPDGVAHFLEHKMFEKEEGDVFQKFSALGASANAFTSFTRTSYLFSATQHVLENIELLLDFVQTPYFTEETVEKEKGIIAQEIQMYEDNPDWRLSFAVLKNLFPDHPLHVDIAGTVESIQEIRPEDLYMSYDTFYHPSNMQLLVVGAVDPEAIFATVRKNQAQKEYIAMPEPTRYHYVQSKESIIHESTLEMEVFRPKVVVGGRYFGPFPEDPKEKKRFEFAARYGLDLLFGDTSPIYGEWYEEGIIDDSFYHDFNLEEDLCYFELGGDSNDPHRFARLLETVLFNLPLQVITEERLERLKKRHLGRLFHSLNSVEYIANHYDEGEGVVLFDHPEIINSITLGDVKRALNQIIDYDTMTKAFIMPVQQREE